MKLLTVLSFLLLLIVCSDSIAKKHIIAPIPGAAACVLECEVSLLQCRDRIDGQANQCKSMYRRLRSDYDYCIATASNSGHCRKPKRCPVKRNSQCAKPYDKCFIACGGRIE